MNYFSFTRSLALLICLSLLSSPTQAVITSLSLWKWNPDDTPEPIEIFIIGDTHISGYSPDDENIIRDKQDSILLQSALHTWNNLDDFACLIESNEWIAKQNKERFEEQYSNQNALVAQFYAGIYYTLPDYIATNKEGLSHSTFNLCDIRGKAFFQTKEAIMKLQNILKTIQAALKNDPSVWIDNDALQKNLYLNLPKNLPIANKFFKEFRNCANTIQERINSETAQLDEITSTFLQTYVNSLNEKITNLGYLLNQHLDNLLERSMGQTLVRYIIDEAKLDEKNQTDRAIALDCIKDCLNILTEFNASYEKLTNYIADAGFILALNTEIKHNNKIVIFCGNNHAVALSEYLQKYQDCSKAHCSFAEGYLEYQHRPFEITEKEEISYNQCHKLFCIPFNKAFTQEDISSCIASSKVLFDTTRPYICTSCPKISIDKSFARCKGCKTTYYCSTNCQRNNWKKHKTICNKQPDSSKKPPSQEQPSFEISWPWIAGGTTVLIGSIIAYNYFKSE